MIYKIGVITGDKVKTINYIEDVNEQLFLKTLMIAISSTLSDSKKDENTSKELQEAFNAAKMTATIISDMCFFIIDEKEETYNELLDQ